MGPGVANSEVASRVIEAMVSDRELEDESLAKVGSKLSRKEAFMAIYTSF